MHPPKLSLLHMHMCGWRDKINSHPDRMDHLSNLYCLWLSDSFDLCSIVIIRWILVIMSFLLLGTYFERSQSSMEGIKSLQLVPWFLQKILFLKLPLGRVYYMYSTTIVHYFSTFARLRIDQKSRLMDVIHSIVG